MTQTSKPINTTLKPGNYLWCACNKSSNMPLCSNNQDGTPCQQSKPFTIKEEGWLKLCGCGQSARPPYCDGTHNKL